MPTANLPDWVRGDSRMVTPGKRDRLTAEIARETWRYDPDTGLLFWKVKRPKAQHNVGDVAGCITKPRGEWVISYGSPPGNQYKATHIIWLIVEGEWPEFQIDHEDNYPPNNAWYNLRPATNQQNQFNRPKLANNTSGYKGVSLHRPSGKYFVQIRSDGKHHFLGAYDTAEEAGEVYREAAIAMHGDFAKT
jgi:hypothetical protein